MCVRLFAMAAHTDEQISRNDAATYSVGQCDGHGLPAVLPSPHHIPAPSSPSGCHTLPCYSVRLSIRDIFPR